MIEKTKKKNKTKQNKKNKKDRWDSVKPRRQQTTLCDIQIALNSNLAYIYNAQKCY